MNRSKGRARAVTLVAALVTAVSTPIHGAAARTSTECTGVRPGAEILVFEEDRQDPPKGNGPAMNFVFQGSDGYRYVGIAGHSVAEAPTEIRTWRPGEEDRPAMDGAGNPIGAVAFVALDNPDQSFDALLDFALVRLNHDVAADPAMCGFAGPFGTYEERSSSTRILHHYGQGDGFEETVPGRTAIAPTTAHPHRVLAVAAIVGGDSGSPVVTEDGAAVGHISGTCAICFLGPKPPPDGTPLPPKEYGPILILRLGPQVRFAEQAMGISLELITAPA